MAIPQEKLMEIGFKIMSDSELMAKLASADDIKSAFGLIADKLEGVSYEEFMSTISSLAPLIPQLPDEQLLAMPNGALFVKAKSWLKDLPAFNTEAK